MEQPKPEPVTQPEKVAAPVNEPKPRKPVEKPVRKPRVEAPADEAKEIESPKKLQGKLPSIGDNPLNKATGALPAIGTMPVAAPI